MVLAALCLALRLWGRDWSTQCQDNVTRCGIMSSVLGMILQWGSTIKVSVELPVTTRYHHDLSEKLLKATLNKQTVVSNFSLVYAMKSVKSINFCISEHIRKIYKAKVEKLVKKVNFLSAGWVWYWYLSQGTAKLTNRHVRSTKTQITFASAQSLSETLLSAWRSFGPLTVHKVNSHWTLRFVCKIFCISVCQSCLWSRLLKFLRCWG